MALRNALAVVALGLAAFATAQNGGLQAAQGKPAPNFVMTTVAGKRLTNANLKGKVVLMDFWATWCGPCKMASPVMQRLHKAYGKKGLVVIGADTFERSNPKAAAAGYKKAHGFDYTFTYNNDGLAQSLGIESIPAFIIVDKKGVVRKVMTGVPSNLNAFYASFEKAIKPLLAG